MCFPILPNPSKPLNDDRLPDYANTANGPNHVEYLTYGRNWAVSKWAYPGAVTNASVVNKVVDFNWPNQIAYVKGQFKADLDGGATGANSLFLMSGSNTANDIFNSWDQAAGNTADARAATIGAMLNTIGTGLNDVSSLKSALPPLCAASRTAAVSALSTNATRSASRDGRPKLHLPLRPPYSIHAQDPEPRTNRHRQRNILRPTIQSEAVRSRQVPSCVLP